MRLPRVELCRWQMGLGRTIKNYEVMDMLEDAAESGNVKFLRFLQEIGCTLETIHRARFSILDHAFHEGQERILQWLKKEVGAVILQDCRVFYEWALLRAMEKGYAGVLRWLWKTHVTNKENHESLLRWLEEVPSETVEWLSGINVHLQDPMAAGAGPEAELVGVHDPPRKGRKRVRRKTPSVPQGNAHAG